MKLTLDRHQDTPCTAVARIDVDVERLDPSVLTVRYRLTGALDGLFVPVPAPPDRTDDLWRRTCFEAFIRGPVGEGYVEFNLSPSTRWAAYRFTGFRSGGSSPEGVTAPAIVVQSDKDGLILETSLDLGPWTGLPAEGPWRLALSAVIEEADGRVSFWALAHPPGKADFHHADCFAAEIPAPPHP